MDLAGPPLTAVGPPLRVAVAVFENGDMLESTGLPAPKYFRHRIDLDECYSPEARRMLAQPVRNFLGARLQVFTDAAAAVLNREEGAHRQEEDDRWRRDCEAEEALHDRVTDRRRQNREAHHQEADRARRSDRVQETDAPRVEGEAGARERGSPGSRASEEGGNRPWLPGTGHSSMH